VLDGTVPSGQEKSVMKITQTGRGITAGQQISSQFCLPAFHNAWDVGAYQVFARGEEEDEHHEAKG
jgi:hypothetical protein